MRDTDTMINEIVDFYIKTTYVSEKHKKITKQVLLNTLTNLTDSTHFSYSLQCILSRIKNHNTRYEKGCRFLNVIPKEWNLTQIEI